MAEPSSDGALSPSAKPKPTCVAAKVTLFQLLAATYFMVASGPYGLEDIVKHSGYSAAIFILLITPVIWSLPTALMVSELATALPDEGGFYVWVRRALGPFWGFQEAWLSLAASIFDMAIYPALFAKYLAHLSTLLGGPNLGGGYWPWAIGAAVVAACAGSNLRGARSVGASSVVMTLLLLAPFAVLTVLGFRSEAAPAAAPAEVASTGLMAGMLIAMWNYMGWDNASTIAGEVDRPQRTYPLAMLGALVLVVLTYVIPTAAASRVGIASSDWDTGSWVTIGTATSGPGLGMAIALGGMVAGMAGCNSLVLSYSRLPMVLAQDGYLPAVFKRRSARTGAPWVSIIVCAIAWSVALQLPFEHLVSLDVILYGLSLILELVALAALRIREPTLARPFRVPGGLVGALLLGVGPTLLIGIACFHYRAEQAGPINGLLLGAILVALGPVVYLIRHVRHSRADFDGGVVPAALSEAEPISWEEETLP